MNAHSPTVKLAGKPEKTGSESLNLIIVPRFHNAEKTCHASSSP